MLDGNGIGKEDLNNGILSEGYNTHPERHEPEEDSNESSTYSTRRESRTGYDGRAQRYARNRRGGTARQTGGASGQKSSLGLLGVQTVICVVALLAAFLLSLSNSTVFKDSKTFIAQALSRSVTQQQVTEAFAAIKKNIDASGFFQLTTSSAASGLKTAVSTGSSSSSAASSAAVSSGQASSSAAASVASSSTASSADKGGEDLDAVFSGSELVPPKSASLGPFKLSVVPIWPVSGEITSGFGYRINPITKQLSFHTGTDIGSAKGTPILASISGTVEDAGKNDAYGNYILLSHGNGVETFYGHCDSVLKNKGDTVKAGDKIALVGTTGMSTGPHLHFEIRVNQISFNPQWLLKS